MKYLEKTFSLSMYTPSPNAAWFRILHRAETQANRRKARKPHEYLNGGSMCQLCGLAKEAERHRI